MALRFGVRVKGNMARLKIYSNYLKLLRQLSTKGIIKSLNLAHDHEWVMTYFFHDGMIER
jgi:hypothetical protein